MNVWVDTSGDRRKPGKPTETQHCVERLRCLDNRVHMRFDLFLESKELVVREFVRGPDGKTPHLASRAESLQQRLSRPALSRHEEDVMSPPHEVPSKVKHEPLRTAVAALAGRIEWIIRQSDDEDIHDNPELSG